MKSVSLESILKDFNPAVSDTYAKGDRAPGRYPCIASVRLSQEEKARYDRLQTLSRGTGRRFSEVVREGFIALMDLAESRLNDSPK